ncbi:MAG: ribosome biogenesis GTP-binding protein YsxC [Planctomycetes bacterium]|nr:ribosome biogenesis GTP-binding protein YsxC [Planctomycetota bacterium]
MSQPLSLAFVTAVPAVDMLPPTRSEVALIGRSNVGKSSLLNALAGNRVLAAVSNTPGRTQLLHCFRVEPGQSTLVDCPGYGFAKAPKDVRVHFAPMIEAYLLEREQLAMTVLLADGEIGPTKSDLQMLDWLRENSLPVFIVATKHDQVPPSHRHRRQNEVAAACRIEPANMLWVSSKAGLGIDRLRELVRLWLA